MMKKLLTLLIILVLASMASATLQISVGGVLEPIDSEIWCDPSEYLELDVWTDADIPVGATDFWMLVVATTDGTITGGVALDLGNPNWSNQVTGSTQAAAAVIPPAGMEGIWGNVANFDFETFEAIPAGTVLANGIDYHCEWGPHDTVVQLYFAPDGVQAGPGDLYDQVIIHQTPEPMTIALLGLGGLFLRRRK